MYTETGIVVPGAGGARFPANFDADPQSEFVFYEVNRVRAGSPIIPDTASLTLRRPGNFDGDAFDELLFEVDGPGTLYIAQVENNVFSGWQLLTGLGVNWDVVAVGDVSGDGRDDLIVRNSLTHQVWYAEVLLGGGVAWTHLFGLDSQHIVRGMGDYNNDGHLDLVVKGPDDRTFIAELTDAGFMNWHYVGVTGGLLFGFGKVWAAAVTSARLAA